MVQLLTKKEETHSKRLKWYNFRNILANGVTSHSWRSRNPVFEVVSVVGSRFRGNVLLGRFALKNRNLLYSTEGLRIFGHGGWLFRGSKVSFYGEFIGGTFLA